MKRRYLHSVTDYYFISFPKSGRTWTKSVLANYYALVNDVDVFHDFSPIRRTPGHTGIPRIIFTHANHLKGDEGASEFIRSLRPKKVVLLVRDPAATTQSFYYRLLKRKQVAEVQGIPLDKFVSLDHLGLAQVVRFLNRWFNAGSSFEGFYVLSYERCVANPKAEFFSLLSFLGEDVETNALEQAVNRSLDTTRKIEMGGLEVDAEVLKDIETGDAIYLGRESATELQRFEGNNKNLLDNLSPEAAARAAETYRQLAPELAALFSNANTPAEGNHP